MDWVALGLGIATALISIGTIIMKVKSIQAEVSEFKEDYKEHVERDNNRFDEHTRRLNDQAVAHQAIHTSLQFIMAKLDKIEESVRR